MAVLVNNERLDSAILELDGKAKQVINDANFAINVINNNATISVIQLEKLIDHYSSIITFFERISIRADVIAEAKSQYDDNNYAIDTEIAALVVKMKAVLNHILTVLGTNTYWSVYQYDAAYNKTYNNFNTGAAPVSTLNTLLQDVITSITLV